MLNKNIPVYAPYLEGNEKKYLLDCIESGWISSRGKYVELFEKSFAKYLNIGYASSVSNGTVALHLALKVLGVGEGDEVIVPSLTYIASVNSISYVGATPIFVDSSRDDWNIDPNLILHKITKKTKAILIVHLYGAPCDMDAISKICKEHNIYLIEDVAEAFGTKYMGRYAGTFGDVATFSFFGNKTITTGEGGMVVSNNLGLIEKVAYLKSQAVSSTKEYWHDEVGFNYRMTNLCAAIGCAQLELADTILEKKLEIASWYFELLSDSHFEFQKVNESAVNSHWMISILTKNIKERDDIRAF